MEKSMIEIVKLTAAEGMFLTNGAVVSSDNTVYLAKGDSADNWREITAEEKERLEAANELSGLSD